MRLEFDGSRIVVRGNKRKPVVKAILRVDTDNILGCCTRCDLLQRCTMEDNICIRLGITVSSYFEYANSETEDKTGAEED